MLDFCFLVSAYHHIHSNRTKKRNKTIENCSLVYKRKIEEIKKLGNNNCNITIGTNHYKQ